MGGPDPAVAAVRSAIARCLTDLAAGELALVACSGGPDSLALAAGTAFLAGRQPAPIRAAAVVVDHGWHPDSARIADRAAGACRALGLDPVEVVGVVAPARPVPGSGGPEAVARQARYRALDAVADRLGAAAVLLGHTLDDQAETVLLGLSRGSGARSLAGMPARRGRYRRPLLGLPRAVTTQACSALGLRPWHDPANDDPAYARARLRQATGLVEAALGPGLRDALARSADLLREDADALDALAADLLSEACVTPLEREAPVLLEPDRLAGAPDAIRRRVLLLAARQAGSPAGALGRRHVLAVDALVMRWRGQGPVALPGGVVARRECGRLLLARRQELAGREGAVPCDDDGRE